MTLTELYKVVKDKDIYEMYVWANWFFRVGRVSFVEFIRNIAMMYKKTPKCEICGLPYDQLKKRNLNNFVEIVQQLLYHFLQ